MNPLLVVAMAAVGLIAGVGSALERDVIETSAGELAITFIGHGSLMLEFGGKVIHVDPYRLREEYDRLPKADLILLTHHHPDHLDPAVLPRVRTDATVVVGTALCAAQLPGSAAMTNGEMRTEGGIRIEAVPAYNLVHKRPNGQVFHPRGEGNGYVLTFGDQRVYIAGDTENTPEMKALEKIDVAFLPMNLPYTMTPEMAADAARAFKPRILYPYHFGDADPGKLKALLKDSPEIEVRARRME